MPFSNDGTIDTLYFCSGAVLKLFVQVPRKKIAISIRLLVTNYHIRTAFSSNRADMSDQPGATMIIAMYDHVRMIITTLRHARCRHTIQDQCLLPKINAHEPVSDPDSFNGAPDYERRDCSILIHE
ncbi:predicted protein [Plenodomus lingam JN3]|uniref:Predicted protein n=1 Tax=Leptosphaeria maculans (strain JN3 / isolate v23.1.3 / race Av1-4-5-6-7-8) TaxID=985895 RepID=E5A3R3_LEPMJ|nr:predicted protein [Plenodomus lingam JN3]CBX98276.1 predicted protein [Plenodomus lingam JN3]